MNSAITVNESIFVSWQHTLEMFPGFKDTGILWKQVTAELKSQFSAKYLFIDRPVNIANNKPDGTHNPYCLITGFVPVILDLVIEFTDYAFTKGGENSKTLSPIPPSIKFDREQNSWVEHLIDDCDSNIKRLASRDLTGSEFVQWWFRLDDLLRIKPSLAAHMSQHTIKHICDSARPLSEVVRGIAKPEAKPVPSEPETASIEQTNQVPVQTGNETGNGESSHTETELPTRTKRNYQRLTKALFDIGMAGGFGPESNPNSLYSAHEHLAESQGVKPMPSSTFRQLLSESIASKPKK